MVASLPEEVLELIASGVDVYVATCDGELSPESVLGMGLRVSEDRSVLTVYVPEVLAEATRRNLAVNPEVAVTVEHASDANAVQIKGRAIATRPSTDADRE
ncbi:MAG TPA: pyridoxamine 5'-phosphate oxidase family protein, partial [Polyangiaceae bacterium]